MSNMSEKSEDLPCVLSPDEKSVFTHMVADISPKDIATKLSKNPGYVRKTKTRVRKKIKDELDRVSKMIRLQCNAEDLSKDKGILLCFDFIHNTPVYLVFTIKYGILVYYVHDCSSKCNKTCLETLEWILDVHKNVQLDKKVSKLSNRLKFDHVFETIRKKGT